MNRTIISTYILDTKNQTRAQFPSLFKNLVINYRSQRKQKVVMKLELQTMVAELLDDFTEDEVRP